MLSLISLLSLHAALAAAPVPVQLPPAEPQRDWPQLLAEAGLGLGAPGGWGASVADPGDGTTWQVHLVDKSGAAQDLVVLIPTNESERADLVWYLAKLLGAEPPPLEPIPPQPFAAASIPAPAPVAKAPAAPVQAPAAAPVQAPAAPPVQAPVATPQFFARAALSASVRGMTGAAVVPELTAGVHAGLLRAGAYGAVRSAAQVSGVGENTKYGALEVGAGVWAMPDLPVGGGILGGVSVRSFTAGGNPVTSIAIPVVAAEALGHFALGKTGFASHIGVEPLARVQVDLRSVELQLRRGDTVSSTIVLPGWDVRFGVGFTWN